MTRLVIFDFDGTLGDTSVTILMSFNETIRRLGLPPVPEKIVRETTGLPLTETFRIGCGLEGDALEEATTIYREIFNTDGLKYIRLFPGVRETLDTLKERGMLLGVATSRHMKSLSFLTDYLGIRDHFSVMNTVDTVPTPKPAPDTVLACLKTLNIDASEAVVVGDTTFDLQMGRNAGCRVCGVTYGNHSREMLASESPDYLVDDMRKLCKLI